MNLEFERAKAITDQRNAAMMACDSDAFLDLWADDCIVEGPDHYLEGKEQLRAAMEVGWASMRPIEMVTRSLAVEGDAMYYEFAIVWEERSTGNRILFTGMTYHQIDSNGHLLRCREYFDPPGKPRRTAAESAELAPILNGTDRLKPRINEPLFAEPISAK